MGKLYVFVRIWIIIVLLFLYFLIDGSPKEHSVYAMEGILGGTDKFWPMQLISLSKLSNIYGEASSTYRITICNKSSLMWLNVCPRYWIYSYLASVKDVKDHSTYRFVMQITGWRKPFSTFHRSSRFISFDILYFFNKYGHWLLK